MFEWLFIVVLALCYIASSVVKPRNYPPGPRWYPIFGCNNVMQSKIQKCGSQWKAMFEMAKEYNTDILGLKLGHENVIVVYGKKYVNQVCSGKEFDARPDSFTVRLRCLGKRTGITFVDGALWREHRMFTMKRLRSVGYGKPSMDVDIQDSMNAIFSYIDKSNGIPINIKSLVSMCTMNVLWKYTGGECIQDKKLMNFINLLSERTKITTLAGGWLNQWPWLRFLASEWSGYSRVTRMNEQIVEIINESINKHLNKEIQSPDYMYSFLEEMYNLKPTYTLDQLTGVCLDLLLAGSQTVGNTFDFVIIAALRNRDLQDKVYNEIMNTIGNKIPAWNDSGRLVYTTAFLAETQRMYTIAHFSGPRRTLCDVQIGKYTVPKDSTILISLEDLHYDERYWDEPENFNPDRFIDENGALKTSTMSFPFGLGRRKCPGQRLAKAALFIMLVRILQKYKIECVNGELPSEEPIYGMLSEPKPFTARFIKRDS